ncbi:choice-of-anchor D domain-containing protein [Myxococcota bacterium]
MKQFFGMTGAFVVLLGSCSNEKLHSLPPAPPEITVQPTQLAFSPTSLGQPVVHTLAISNTGGRSLSLESIVLSTETSDEFDWEPLDPEVNRVSLPNLKAGQSLEVQVIFTPADRGREIGTLLISSNDEDESPLEVPLATLPIGAAVLTCMPNPVMLATIPPQPTQRTVSCINEGSATLTVEDIQRAAETSADFDIVWPEIPFDVAGGGPFQIEVTYAPQAVGTGTGSLTIVSNAIDGDYELQLVGEGTEEEVCIVSVFPPMLGFSNTYVNDPADQTALLSNSGTGPCVVTSIAPTLSTDSPFSYVGALPLTLAPSDSRSITIRYTPRDTTMDNDFMYIGTADPDAGAGIMVNGNGIAAYIQLYPCPYDFGTVLTGCPAQQDFFIDNVGIAPLNISSATISGGDAQFVLLSDPPASIGVGGGPQIFTIGYTPGAAGDHPATLTIVSNDPYRGTLSCELSGAGSDDGHVVEIFDTATPQVDMLLVVDDSGSMDEQADTLANSIPALLNHLEDWNVSYHLGLTTTDVTDNENPFVPGKRGRLLGDPKIVTNDTPNAQQALRNNLGLADMGSGTECGLEASRLALTEPLVSTENAGFLRQSARLLVIYMSDEEDKSPDGETISPVSTYVGTLLNVKNNDPNLLRAVAIVVLEGETCGPEVGTRYLELVDVVGGMMTTLCVDDFSPAFTDLAQAITDPPDRFFLDSPVAAGTLQVFVDNVLQPSDTWAHDSDTNSISFNEGADPLAGSVVRIEYITICST